MTLQSYREHYMPSLMPTGKQHYFFPGTGLPLIGGKLYTYAAGTSTPKATYQDAAGNTPNTNPVVLDSSGSALIFWDGAYKVVIKDALGNTVYTVDNYTNDPFGVGQFLTNLASSTGASLVGFLQSGAGAVKRWVLDKLADTVNGADFGMVADWNGAAGTDNTAAFTAALAAMKQRGGGTLTINPGDYYFGSYATSAEVVKILNLVNTRINAYGARFILNTTAEATPFLLVFDTPNDVTLAGAHFYDVGFNPASWQTHSRWGMGAVELKATNPCKGFRMVDCVAENLTYLLVADHRTTKRNMKNVMVEDCRVKMAYYGVDVLYLGDNLKISNLICEDVRRGLIGYGMHNVDADIKLYTNQGFQGSNAFVSIACEGRNYNDGYGVLGTDGDVKNLRVKLNVTGYEAHSAYVHFYHQQADGPGEIDNVKAEIMVNDLSQTGKAAGIGATNLFLFDHELPDTSILGTTTRTCKGIDLDARMTGAISGVPVAVNSSNPANPFSISLSPSLFRLAHTYTVNQFTGDSDFQTPFERVLTTLIPVGDVVAGAPTGLTCVGTWVQIGKRIFFNAVLSWTAHTGTGNLRINGLPKPIDVAQDGLASIAITASGLAHPAGTQIMGLIGGSANSQIILYSESGGAINALPMDTAVGGLYLTGSYVTP